MTKTAAYNAAVLVYHAWYAVRSIFYQHGLNAFLTQFLYQLLCFRGKFVWYLDLYLYQ